MTQPEYRLTRIPRNVERKKVYQTLGDEKLLPKLQKQDIPRERLKL